MKRIIILLLAISFNLSLFSHPWKPNHYVMIDTDGGIDDLRAITMLLASPDIRVLAITISPGALNSDKAYIKVKSLLNSFYHEGIPVGLNRISKFKSPDFPVAFSALWGNEIGLDSKDAPDYLSIINEILAIEKTKISFICLGGLSTVSSLIHDSPLFSNQVKEIIWSIDGNRNYDGFNYGIDAASAAKVLKGKLPVKTIQGTGDQIFYDETLIKEISDIQSLYAEKITALFRSDDAKNHKLIYTGNDDMVPLYLHHPELFIFNSEAERYIGDAENLPQLRKNTIKILSGETVVKNQVINTLPDNPEFYSPDIEESVSEIIKKYGKDEWVSGVIANELHRHLGVFAIVGVKMGIRAREFFNTGVDEFSAISFAGSVPPMSCMNDGLQVSTGATPGHGLLTVKNDVPAIPSAEFTYMNRKIKLTLKPEIAEKIISELKEINFIYGLDSNIYWELVRKNSIKYWLNLDRHEIFNIEYSK